MSGPSDSPPSLPVCSRWHGWRFPCHVSGQLISPTLHVFTNLVLSAFVLIFHSVVMFLFMLQSQENGCQQALNNKHSCLLSTWRLTFLSLEVQRLFSYVTLTLIESLLISSLLPPCQCRCSDVQLRPFLICDIYRSCPLPCCGGAEARGPPFGIWRRYGMVSEQSTNWLIRFILNVILILFYNPESSGLSFQLASLDETGVLNFWVGQTTG